MSLPETLATSDARPAPRPAYVLGVLTILLALNYVDRNIFNVLIQPIKNDLQVSDAAIGFMSSMGLGIFLAVLTVPFARLADRTNRVLVISSGLFFWSAMTVASGLAASVLMMLAARTLVGVGEASCIGPAQALLADYFPVEKRARAMSIYSSATFIGVLLAFVLGAVINAHFGWRATFFIVGAPGALFALLTWFTVADQPRRSDETSDPSARGGEVIAALRFLFAQKSFRYITAGACLVVMANFALITWVTPLLQRAYHFSNMDAGLLIGPVSGFGGIAGALASAAIMDRLSARDLCWTLWAPAIGAAVYALAMVGLCLSQTMPVMLVSLCGTAVSAGFLMGPVLAANLSVVKPGMRGIAAAFNFTISSLLGIGLAPLVVGWASDVLLPRFGAMSLRYALLLGPMALAIAVVVLLGAGRHLKTDMKNAAA